ncbi:MAG: hypothetical protein ACOYKZ_00370 [Chlamydiia bacterium]
MSLSDKIAKIQALIDRAGSPGEREAALAALARVQRRVSDQPKEFSVHLPDMWSKQLFMAVCSKFGLRTYRYSRQKHTTAMVRVSQAVMDECLWPEYQRVHGMLQELQRDLVQGFISRFNQGEELQEDVIAGALTGAQG